MICQCRVITYNKCTILVGDVDGEVVWVWRQEVHGESLYFGSIFLSTLKLLWKKCLFKKFPYLCNMIAFFYTSNSYLIIPECSYFCFHYLILHSWWFQYIFKFGMHWNVWNTIFIQQETKTWFLNGVIKYCNEWESLFCVAGYLIMY